MTRRLAAEKQQLDTAMNTMTQGLLMFDQDERLIVCNRRYIEMYGLSADVVKPGAYFRDVIQHRHDTGSFHGDVDSYCDGILGNAGRDAEHDRRDLRWPPDRDQEPARRRRRLARDP